MFSWSIVHCKLFGFDLCIVIYENNLDKIEFISELESLRNHIYILYKFLNNACFFGMFNLIYKNSLPDAYLTDIL